MLTSSKGFKYLYFQRKIKILVSKTVKIIKKKNEGRIR